jgi:hypothetical protein
MKSAVQLASSSQPAISPTSPVRPTDTSRTSKADKLCTGLSVP